MKKPRFTIGGLLELTTCVAIVCGCLFYWGVVHWPWRFFSDGFHFRVGRADSPLALALVIAGLIAGAGLHILLFALFMGCLRWIYD